MPTTDWCVVRGQIVPSGYGACHFLPSVTKLLRHNSLVITREQYTALTFLRDRLENVVRLGERPGCTKTRSATDLVLKEED